jgi:hypothetical protein
MAETKKPYKILKVGKYGEFHLSKPTFDVYAKAMSTMGVDDKKDVLRAGRVIFQALYMGNNGTIAEISKNVPLIVQLSLDSFASLEFIGDQVEKK